MNDVHFDHDCKAVILKRAMEDTKGELNYLYVTL